MYSTPASRRPYSVTLLCACAITPADISAAASNAFFIFSSIPCQKKNPVLRMVSGRQRRRTEIRTRETVWVDRVCCHDGAAWSYLYRHADPSSTGISSACFEVKLLLINFVLVLWLLIYQKYPSMGEEIGSRSPRCLKIAIVVWSRSHSCIPKTP